MGACFPLSGTLMDPTSSTDKSSDAVKYSIVNIPNEILVEILSNLDHKNLLKCTLVSDVYGAFGG